MQVRVDGPKEDLHSGVDGGVVVEPFSDLMAILADLACDSLACNIWAALYTALMTQVAAMCRWTLGVWCSSRGSMRTSPRSRARR